MDWYHNTQFSDPDDDGVLLDATCKNCGAPFYVYADSLIDGQIPGGELCGDCEAKAAKEQSRLTMRAAGLCPTCAGKGKLNVAGTIYPCADCVGTGQSR